PGRSTTARPSRGATASGPSSSTTGWPRRWWRATTACSCGRCSNTSWNGSNDAPNGGPVRITNEGPESSGEGSLAELLRLQAEFQAHLAEETLRYLRAVQATLAPRSPGTVVQPAPDARLQP